MTGPITVGPLTGSRDTVGPLTGSRDTVGHLTGSRDTVDDLRGQFLNSGRYRLLELLGVGGPSEVWLAQDTHLERQVAIKTLRADAGGRWAELTAHEARTLAQIDHPHVVPIYDSFAERDRPWIVMKFIRGRTLADILETEGPLPGDKVWDVALALSSALAASHQAGIVHRDLKPANVMIGHDNSIWLVDFGIALHGRPGDAGPPGQAPDRPSSTAPDVPQSRVAAGTLAYMAPESLSGRPDRPADLWSLGVLLVTLATGRNPFQRSDPMATAGAILHAPIPELPVPSLESVGRRLLQRNPRRRPPADELAAQLRAGMPVVAELPRRRRLPGSAPPAGPSRSVPATRVDSQLVQTGLAYWGMSQIIDHPLEPAQLRSDRLTPERPESGSVESGRDDSPAERTPPGRSPQPRALGQRVPPPWAPPRRPEATPAQPGPRPAQVSEHGRERAARRSPAATARHAITVTVPVLGGWSLQALVAFAGCWLGLLCVAPLALALPPTPMLLAGAAGCAAVSVAAACLSAGRLHASSGRWLTITVGWATVLSVGMATALQLGPIAAGAVPLVALALAVWVRRISAAPDHHPGSSGARESFDAAATVTALAAAVAVAIGPAAASGVLVLAGGPPASVAVLVAAWGVGLVGVAVTLSRSRPGLPDLLVICCGIVTTFTTTAVVSIGFTVWQDAFGRSARWSDDTSWWAYGLAAGVLALGVAGQVRLGRAIRVVGAPEPVRPSGPVGWRSDLVRLVAPTAAPPAGKSVSGLGVLMFGGLAAAVVGAAVGVAAMAWVGQLVLPPVLFVVPVTAGSYVVARSACARLTADPPRPVGQRKLARYGWVAGWTALLVVVLALSPPALDAIVPHQDAAGLAVGAAVCTLVGGIAGQLPVERAFRWARRQTGPTLAHHSVRLAAQLAAAAAGVLVAFVVAQLDGPEPTPPGVVVAVVVATFGIVVVDLAHTGTVVSCAFVLLGVAAAMVAGCWLQGQLQDRIGSASERVVMLVAGLAAVGAAGVFLVRFAAELTRNTRGERSNHAFSALVFATAAAGAVYGILALAG